MRRMRIPPEWRYPLLGLVALLIAANRILPLWLVGGALCIIGGIQVYEVWQRIMRHKRASSVTYWRGVRYETPATQTRPSWRDIQAELLWVVLGITTLVAGISIVLRVMGW